MTHRAGRMAVWLFAFLLVAAAAPARAQPVTALQALAMLNAQAGFAPGTKLAHVVPIRSIQVPLPQGDWVVAGDAQYDFHETSFGAYGRMRNIILFRVAGRRVDAVAEINANVLPTGDGWGIPGECTRTDLVAAVVRYKSGWDAACFFISHALSDDAAGGSRGPAAWPAAATYAARERLVVPRLWLTAGFRVADRSSVVDLRISFDPTARGIARETPRRWKDSAWAGERLATDAPRKALGETVGAWAIAFLGLVESGMRGRLGPQDVLAMPGEGGPPANPVLVQRERLLQDLHRDGLLDEAKLTEQLRRLTEFGLNPGGEQADPSTIAFYKTLSYRPAVSFINFWIDLYWIGVPFAAGKLEVLQVTVNSVKFYAHELAWTRFASGTSHLDVAQSVDFVHFAQLN